MSVVIVGGNECMVRRYKEICDEYHCKSKVFPKTDGALKGIGSPDLLVLFTGTVSHKMVISAFQEAKRNNVPVARVHSSSACALHAVLSARCTCCGAAEGVL